MQLSVLRLSDNAILPVRASPHSAGYDLHSAYEYTVKAGGKEVIYTDIAIAVPGGYYGRIAPRSSLAVLHHINVGAGVIDADYRGDIRVVLFNHSAQDFEVKRGHRIAQLILEKIATPPVVEVNTLDITIRGDGGFGSTGV